MQSFTQGAARIIDPAYSVNVLCNYFYALGGTLFVIAACWYVTDRIVEPRLRVSMPLDSGLEQDPDLQLHAVSDRENRAFRLAGGVMLLMALGAGRPHDSGRLAAAQPGGSLTSPDAPVMRP